MEQETRQERGQGFALFTATEEKYYFNTMNFLVHYSTQGLKRCITQVGDGSRTIFVTKTKKKEPNKKCCLFELFLLFVDSKILIVR